MLSFPIDLEGVGGADFSHSSNPATASTDLLAEHGRYAQRVATPPGVKASIGGRYAQIAFGEPYGACLHRGDRGQCVGFSAASRRAMVHFMKLVPEQRCIAVTLTFPDKFPGPREAKEKFRAWWKRVRRAWGRRGVVWKLEPQKRLAPHFHLIVQARGIDVGQCKQFTDWAKESWYQIAGEGQQAHRRYGCYVDFLDDADRVGAYAAKYAAKVVLTDRGDEGRAYFVTDDGELLELSEDWKSAGRWWGKEDAGEWGIRVDAVALDQGHAAYVDRMARRWLDASCRAVVRGAKDKKARKKALSKLRRVRKYLRRERPACTRSLYVPIRVVLDAVESYPPCLVSAGEGQQRITRIPGRLDPHFWHRRCAVERYAELAGREGYRVTWGPDGPEVELLEMPLRTSAGRPGPSTAVAA